MAQLVATKKDPAITIRFPKPILKAVKQAAKDSGRSQNSEIVFRLAQSLGVNEQSAVAAKA